MKLSLLLTALFAAASVTSMSTGEAADSLAEEGRPALSLADAAAARGMSEADLSDQLQAVLGGFPPASVSEAILRLKDKRSTIALYKAGEPRDGRFEAVDDLLVPLLELERSLPVSWSSAMEPISLPAQAFDVLITDIKASDLSVIGSELGVRRLASVPADGTFPVSGIIYGPNHRVFVPLTVRYAHGSAVNVLFLLDTGAPSSFLRMDTLTALGFVDFIPSTANVFVQGVKVSVGVSHGHFHNVDLLGQDFLFRVGAKLTVDYADLSCIIESSVRGLGATVNATVRFHTAAAAPSAAGA